MAHAYVIVYRTGGYANAKWHHTVPTRDYAKVVQQGLDTARMGYFGRIMKWDTVQSVGLPVGFCKHANSLTGEMTEKTCDCL